ncbi:MUB1/samB family protein [Pleurotus pulmonarius]
MHGAMNLINHPCTLCCRPTSMWCSRCQSAWYCSPEHLHNDWARHRKECIPATSAPNQYNVNMIATPPPAEPQYITVSAILFSPEEERPRIITVSCRPSHKPSQGMCPIPLVQSHFADGQAEGIVLTQGLNGEPLRFPLHLWYSPTALSKSAPINRAIYHITSGAAPKPWCGTVVVLKFNGSRRQGYSDAGSNDLPALSAYFLAYK